jgi:CspA family cold shock protein
MQSGTVKWFNNAKGYGFILSNEGGGDIFAHYSAIDMDGYKTLKAGQGVIFDTEDGPKGLHAIKITSDGEPEITTANPAEIVEAAMEASLAAT